MMNAVGSWAVRLTRRAMRFSLRLAHWMARSAGAFQGIQRTWPLIPLRPQGDARVLVFARPHGARLEDLALMDPSEGVLEDFLGVRLEHDALARPPAARVHLRQEA